MKQEVLIGQVDYTVEVNIKTTAGAPATGKIAADVAISYSRVETDNDVVLADGSPSDLASLTAAHADWGLKEIDATKQPGLYRLDIADAVFAAGAWSAVVTVRGAGLNPANCEFPLVVFDPKAAALPANSIANASFAAGAISDGKLAADMHKYQAKVWMVEDGDGNNKYGANFYKDGAADKTPGAITNVKISVKDFADGSDLIPETAMTESGTTEAYKYVEGTNLIEPGEQYNALVKWTRDGVEHEWPQQIGRDSTAP